MKIVYLAASALPARGRANSIQVMMMCEAFARNGHDVTLLAPDKPERMRDVDPHAYYGVQPLFRIEWLPWLALKGRGYVYGWLAARRARDLQPDLAYGRSVPAAFFGTRLGLDAILELHDPLNDREWLLERMFRWMLSQRRLRRIVVTSRSLAGNLQDNYPLAAPLLCLAPNGARDGGPATEKLRLDPGKFHAGYVGGLRPGKGMELIVKLSPLAPWAHFHVVGGSPQEIEHWKSQLGGAANVTFHGQVPPADSQRYCRSFDMLLAPYQRFVRDARDRTAQTPWLSPLKLIEYMAAERPIVCSDLPPYREVLEHGRTALLCDPERADAWIAAFEKLRSDRSFARALARSARAGFERRHTWPARAGSVLEGI